MPKDVVTLRLDRTTRRRLAAVARRRGGTPSAIARTALDGWLDLEEAREARAPFEAIADLVGCVHGGDPGRSSRGARAIAATLQAKRSARARRGP